MADDERKHDKSQQKPERVDAAHAWAHAKKPDSRKEAEKAFIRAENEDDDGYDPYSDRRPQAEPLFERDPWD